MYAVFEALGHQYKVQEGDVINVDKMDAGPGATVAFDRVLLLKDAKGKPVVGKPYIAKASVEAQVITQARGPKIRVFDYKRRHGERKTSGHRADLTAIKITSIKKG